VELDAYNLRQLLKVIAGAEAELKPEFYESLSPKTLAMRHINAIKMHYLRCSQLPQALEILECLTILEPESSAFWREKGLLQARINQLEEAILSLKTSLNYTTNLDTIRHTQHILADLEKKMID